MSTPYVTKRGEVYYFRMAVPKRLKPVYGGIIWRSLHTRSLSEAKIAVCEHVAKWARKFLLETVDDQDISFQKLRDVRRAMTDTSYRSYKDVEEAGEQESFEMVMPALSAVRDAGKLDRVQVAALAGVTENPGMTMTKALERYQELSTDKFMSYSDERERYKRWRPFVQAAKSFTSVMGDVDIIKLKPKDCMKFQADLVKKIADKKLNIDSARKKIMWLRLIHTKILEIDHPDLLPSPWDRIKIEGASHKGKRIAFSDDELRVVRKAMTESDVSDQVKALNTISEMTGATCKELTHLHADDIFLDAPIPYIAIRPNENRNRVKGNGDRIREIPLIGRALEAMKKFPKGFDEFCRSNGSEDLSKISNVIIQKAVPDRSFYSYRHAMADRLRRSGCQDTLKNSIMGHSSKGFSMHYGNGYTLQNKLDALVAAIPENHR
ncbi:DUF6538 domain-containing protein [Neorhizobium sp. JUb45]|uniref:DUF6538 domain-containing protein n=1 Tax=Neorhizobium sp. JUb45 TaxID=2485113 RepID=UPI0010441834|nr:DUF6538 domain-containing protein [Neorhizobium sp. JUb45]TCQ96208.1 hypothetical protein EDF70_11821 [Neorhizobium sp. JUb45]